MKHILIIALFTGWYAHACAQESHTGGEQVFQKDPSVNSSNPLPEKATKPLRTKRSATNSFPASTVYRSADSNMCFPLTRDRQYNVYDFIIPLDDARVIARYMPYFDRRDLKFSGYVWETVLKEMLSDADPALSRFVVLRSESNQVMIKVTKFQVIKQFPEYMCHIFSNMTKFDSYLKRIDMKRVPKY